MELSKPRGWRLVLLRVLQVICLVTSPIVIARFLFSDAIWVAAIVIDAVALVGVVLLYRRAGGDTDQPDDGRPQDAGLGDKPN